MMKTPVKRMLSGQAMTEMLLVSSLVFVPMMLALPLLAKYLDSQHKVEQAAKFAVWERTVWSEAISAYAEHTAVRTDAQLLSRTDRHVFSHDQRPVGEAQATPDSSQIAGPGPEGRSFMQFMAASSRSAAAGVDETSDGQISLLLPAGASNERLLSSLTRVSGDLGGIGSGAIDLMADIFEKTGFRLETNGYVRYRTQINLRPLPWHPALDSVGLPEGGLVYSGNLGMLTNGWQAAGPTEQGRQLAHLNPTGRLGENDFMTGVLQAAAFTPFTEEFSELRLGYSNIDALPASTLKPYAVNRR